MNRTSLMYLIVGLLVGGLVTGGIDASALVPSGSDGSDGSALSASAASVATAAATTAKKKKSTTKKKKSTKKKKAKKKKKPAPAATSTAPSPMIGLFGFKPGAYANGTASGSYIRLVLAGGTRENGPYFPNPSSKATTYTLLNPGTDGGLRTGVFQPAPNPAFNATGDALANRIIAPQRFAFIQYSAQTSAVDPQTGATVPAPSISVADGKLSGQVQAFSAQWNKQNFNVGSPKPDGSFPGLTRPVSGTYDPATKAYVLEWTSQIVGGAFNNFSAFWHFEGTFEPGCG
jgi:hypothetical protein